MNVHDAAIADAAAVRLIAAAAWHNTYAGLLSPSTIAAFVDNAYAIERLERRIDRHTFLVFEHAGSIVAFADAVVEPDRVNLVAIYALPEHRRRGAGSALLAAIRARFPGVSIAADVLVGNRKGEGFYERRGFIPGEEIETDLFGERVVERRWWLDSGLHT
jgi:GNAT superfamily N-acetyltransferase